CARTDATFVCQQESIMKIRAVILFSPTIDVYFHIRRDDVFEKIACLALNFFLCRLTLVIALMDFVAGSRIELLNNSETLSQGVLITTAIRIKERINKKDIGAEAQQPREGSSYGSRIARHSAIMRDSHERMKLIEIAYWQNDGL